MLVAARTALAVAYPLLAHWASHGGGSRAAALALADLIPLVLLRPLVAGHPAAWGVSIVLGTLLYAGRDALWLPMLLLGPPIAFTAFAGALFARTLRPGQVPLITRIALAIEYDDPTRMPAAHRRYTVGLTAAWAALLLGLATANTVLALIAVPHGVLVRLGYSPVVVVSQQTWSWIANLLDYGFVAAFAAVELAFRRWRFPDRERRHPRLVLARMRELGPHFWRAVSR